MAGYYDPDKDYSVAIEEAKSVGASQEYIDQLWEERENKIEDKYGGDEPVMWGSDTKYSEADDDDSDTIESAMQYHYNNFGATDPWQKYAGTDYHQNAIDAAIAGNWDDVMKYLNMRDEKIMAQGDNRGKTSAEILAELMEQYGQKVPLKQGGGGAIPSYNGQYSSQIDSLLNQILNREPFSYDYTKDPTYLAYEDKYKRLGDRAREDTLGSIAAMNGGYASSWATSAASQAQNDYNQQLSDVIPALYDAAYNRYLNEDSLKRDDLGIVQGLDQTEYDRYRDTVEDDKWWTEFEYGQTRDEVTDRQWQQSFDWNKIVDQWNMDNTEATQKFEQMMSKWQMTGVADEEVSKALGVPVGATTESYYFNKAQLSLDQAKISQSNKEAEKAKTEEASRVETILYEARKAILSSGSYSAAAEVVLREASTLSEYYTLCSQLGVSESAARDVYLNAKKEQEEAETNTGSDALFAEWMNKAIAHVGYPTAEDWWDANRYSVPDSIYDRMANRFE